MVDVFFVIHVTSVFIYINCLTEVEETPNRSAFVDGGTVLKIPLFYLEGVLLLFN